MGELQAGLPESDVVLARELTKRFEEFLRGKPAALLEMAAETQLERRIRGARRTGWQKIRNRIILGTVCMF